MLDKYYTINIIDYVKELLSMEENWDGYGGIPLEKKAYDNFLKLYETIDNQCILLIHDYYPNPYGTLSIDWFSDIGELSLEIGNEEMCYYYKLYKQVHYCNEKKVSKEEIKFLEKIIFKIMKESIKKKIRDNYHNHLQDGYSFNIMPYAKIISVEKGNSSIYVTDTPEEYKELMGYLLDYDTDDLEMALFQYWLTNLK